MPFIANHLLRRDLKCSNLLLADNFKIKGTEGVLLVALLRGNAVCDFGMARKSTARATAMTICGTDEYMVWLQPRYARLNLTLQAPEVILGDRYNERADVFSYGSKGYALAVYAYA